MVKGLLGAGAAVDQARTDVGAAPLSVMGEEGYIDVVKEILGAAAAARVKS